MKECINMKLLNVKKSKNMEEKVGNIVSDETMNKSAKMKALFDLGLEVKYISSLLGVRYNFVYNVISNYILINGLEVDTTKTDSKKDLVKRMISEGKEVKEICVELKCNMNYVYKIRKEILDSVEEEITKEEIAVGKE